MGQDWLLAMSIQDVPRRPGRVPAEAHAKGYFARVVDEYLQIGITTPRREQEAISIHADRSVLTCRPRCCLVDRLKAVAYGVEVVALQLAQVIAHTKPGIRNATRPRLSIQRPTALPILPMSRLYSCACKRQVGCCCSI